MSDVMRTVPPLSETGAAAASRSRTGELQQDRKRSAPYFRLPQLYRRTTRLSTGFGSLAIWRYLEAASFAPTNSFSPSKSFRTS